MKHNIHFDTETQTMLSLILHGEPEAGLHQSQIEIILPYPNKHLKEEHEWAQEMKELFRQAAVKSFDDTRISALYDFEAEEIADMAEEKSEQEKGQC